MFLIQSIKQIIPPEVALDKSVSLMKHVNMKSMTQYTRVEVTCDFEYDQHCRRVTLNGYTIILSTFGLALILIFDTLDCVGK